MVIETTLHSIGTSSPQWALYLHTQMPAYSDQSPSHAHFIEMLIKQNGNHWRKILVIWAKLCAPDQHWRDYLYEQLLNEQQIVIGSRQLSAASQHFIAGKANWLQFGFHLDLALPNYHWQPPFCLVPYPDYRQFPNRLIAAIRQDLQANTPT
ncbi:DUF6942 family protein [Celerinatantimonas sp. YJH-8]|uniref:DUF6942 family protein n=1 Tax=Celerinatantimonas sp. YJH-8 TaxID=3228714 RepID=UPI0038C48DA3